MLLHVVHKYLLKKNDDIKCLLISVIKSKYATIHCFFESNTIDSSNMTSTNTMKAIRNSHVCEVFDYLIATHERTENMKGCMVLPTMLTFTCSCCSLVLQVNKNTLSGLMNNVRCENGRNYKAVALKGGFADCLSGPIAKQCIEFVAHVIDNMSMFDIIKRAIDSASLSDQQRAIEYRAWLESVHQNVSQHGDCSICLDMIENATTTNCNHTFCTECIVRWQTSHTTCPLCRQAL